MLTARCGLDSCCMRPDGRARGEKERHRREPVVFACQIEVAVQRPIGKIAEPAVLEIHQQKGKVVKQVTGGENRIEFESVECDRIAVENGDIAEMKVAVAAADQTLRAACGEQGTKPAIGGE